MIICVYAIAKNESRFVSRWVESMREADQIYVLDTGSEDDTVQLLRDAGCTVVQEKIEPWRFDTARNRSLALVPENADICVCTDLDEAFEPGWRQKLEAAWTPGTTRASYRYTWNFEKDGSEGHVFFLDKVHARSGYRWTHPVHEVLSWEGEGAENRVTVEGMQLNHRADPKKSRAQYLPLLELSVQEDPQDDRNTHYLGREYLFYGRWDDCIRTLKRHLLLPKAVWADERCASMRYIARAYLGKKEQDPAEQWLLRAAAEAPHLREPLVELALLYDRRKDWEGVLFATGKALKITDRARTYITENTAWGSLPYDLRAVACFYLGMKKQAVDAAREALRLSPDNPRIKNNLRLIASARE